MVSVKGSRRLSRRWRGAGGVPARRSWCSASTRATLLRLTPNWWAMRRCEAPPYDKRITSLRVTSFMTSPIRLPGPGSRRRPLRLRAPALGSGGTESLDLAGPPQPHARVAEEVPQDSESLPHLVPGFAQPRIAHRRKRALRLRQGFARPRQEVFLLLPSWTSQPQVHHSRQFDTGERFPPHHLQNFRLVALRQPHDLARRGRREQPHPQLLARLTSPALDQGQATAHPTLVAAQQLGHLHLSQAGLPPDSARRWPLWPCARRPPATGPRDDPSPPAREPLPGA